MAGELAAQEIVDLGRLLDGALLVVELAQGAVGPPLGTEDLPGQPLHLEREDVDLVLPLSEPPVPPGLGEGQPCSCLGVLGEILQCLGRRGERVGEAGPGHRNADEVVLAHERVRDRAAVLGDELEYLGVHLQPLRDPGQVLVEQLIADQPVLDQRGVVGDLVLRAQPGLFERLHLPVGVAPLIHADRQRQLLELVLLSRAQRFQELGVALLVRAQQRGPQRAHLAGELKCLGLQVIEAVRAGQLAGPGLAAAAFPAVPACAALARAVVVVTPACQVIAPE